MSNSNVPIDDPLVAILSYPELVERQSHLSHRLLELELPPPPSKRHRVDLIPYKEKTDTHADFLLKEMQWLSADFASERKRHQSLRRRICGSIRSHFASLESRRLKSLADAELKRRRLAARIGRECIKGWWGKIDKIVTYKQKMSAEESRRKAMNQQLVKLVQQTEKYGSGLKKLDGNLSVEQALAQGWAPRRCKSVRDYARLQVVGEELYGESTEDSGSDASYSPSSSDEDETTMHEAEQEERQQRGMEEDSSFVADPLELKKLQEEETMDIELVLERLRPENPDEEAIEDSQREDKDEEAKSSSEPLTKRVKFASAVQVSTLAPVPATEPSATQELPPPSHTLPDPGEDADDDGDASELEDYNNNENDDGEDEEDFVAEEPEVDDETTIALEESLPQEMTAQEEIRMLQAENELSVEELRARYAAAFVDAGDEEDMDEEDSVDDNDSAEPQTEVPSEPENKQPATEDEGVEDEAMESEDSDTVLQPKGSSFTSLLVQGEADDGDAEEFHPDKLEVDDETTMDAEDELGRDMSYEDEIALLKREGEMPIAELRGLYANTGEAENALMDVDEEPDESKPSAAGSKSYFDDVEEQENDDDFLPGEEEKDDETTIEVEERLGREMSVEEEIALLQKEGEEPIEALRERYQSMSSQFKRKREDAVGGRSSEEDEQIDQKPFDSEEDAFDAGRAALDALQASAERARTTRASRPYLLSPSVKLRVYQQVGLNWLVSLQSQRLSGVLADEMGLGKTLQTISLLAYLAAYRGIWGPHLIVVPTSVILNWESELKRFAPAFKVLCYYGPAKRRKELRTGWTKTNWYHVVITSYQLVVQDAFAFKRKKWYYLILDEAQNIKNFQSQRWQTLINFNTQRRLLLTGTPLQNSLMELWSLLHFLMPYIFRSRKQFSYWFANPMNNIIEGSGNQNEDVVNRLHGIIRPFVLRRLKKDVEAQMPGKFEHVIKCQLSRRQMFIYEEFLSRSSTRHALKKGGNFLGMMNVLMALRKVCNHPDLFEPRSVLTPFVTDPISVSIPSCITLVRSSLPNPEHMSAYLLSPLWSGSTGLPHLNAALRHDKIESDELLMLEASLAEDLPDDKTTDCFELPSMSGNCPSALLELLRKLNGNRRKERQKTVMFLNALNSWRCKSSPFPYPRHLLSLMMVESERLARGRHSVLSTPAALLAMRRTLQQRADDVDDLITNFVFCVPSADSPCPVLDTNSVHLPGVRESIIDDVLLRPVQEALQPFRKVQARLSAFFPDKKLVQFDAGKLQTLAELLRELKRGGHRVLIFTQMSKVLDILEAFLNLNGHTYLRLDGSTGVDRRQRLMDRFNNDPKIFCFILSTRSGGLGINLTGADTVVFYDQDWNPAMDAQAQDRAHRIGQTREVHIYRLVTEHSIEENILIKAQQKRNLDILVMDKGNFDASQLFGHGENAKASSDHGGVKDVYTKSGLLSILGVEEGDIHGPRLDSDIEDNDAGLSDENMEKAMMSLEDADDVQALRGAQKEAAEEMKEFDENAEIKKNSDSEDDDEENNDDKPSRSKTAIDKSRKADEGTAREKEEEEELEKEFAAWQDQLGLDAAAIEASLSPTERYGLRFREMIDPFISIFAVQEYRQKMEAEAEVGDEIDIDEIEREKELEEQRAFDDGDLLATQARPEDLIRQRDLYFRERARLKANKKRRKLTGENWEIRKDAVTKHPFWYNIDTGEAIWDKPSVLIELEAFETAQRKLFAAMPMKPLVHVMSYLSVFPDRMKCATVCRQWRSAATDPSFVLHVYPVEMGAYTRDESKMERNHFKTISDAIAIASPGDTIELADGHYWANEDLVVDFPLRFVGDDTNAANVVVEMGGTLTWRALGGLCEGVSFRRPKLSSGVSMSLPLLILESGGRVEMLECAFDNEGGTGPTVAITGPGKSGRWEMVLVKGGSGGISLDEGASFELIRSKIKQTGSFGLQCQKKSEAKLMRCQLHADAGIAVVAKSESIVRLVKCHVSVLPGGKILDKETGASVSCSGNTAPPSSLTVPIPGFRPVEETKGDDPFARDLSS